MAHRIFRSMKARSNTDRLPLCTPGSGTLSVRVGADVIPDQSGLVSPAPRESAEGRGMSVFLDDVRNLPVFRRPAHLGGHGRHPVYQTTSAAISPPLRVRVDSGPEPIHAVVEPQSPQPIQSYQDALCATAPLWKEVR